MSENSTPLFGPENRKTLTEPLVANNPITIQVLGICSTLAVTSQLKPSLVMSLAVVFVLVGANISISVIRKLIPNRVRIIVEMVVVASLVILVDQVLKAYAFEVSKQLSVFVGLIITNCIILGRLEAFALGNRVWPSLLDGLGNGIGYGLILVLVGFARELFGAGTLWGAQIVPRPLYDWGYQNNVLMVLPPAAFILLGLIVWGQRALTGYTEEQEG
jgi:Na+-transporting NADH:ubiquinone oxidoreductase subunit D